MVFTTIPIFIRTFKVQQNFFFPMFGQTFLVSDQSTLYLYFFFNKKNKTKNESSHKVPLLYVSSFPS